MANPTRSDYRNQCRRLLHDPNANFWPDSELNDYISEARNRVVGDTGCLRSLQSFTLTVGQEAYQYSALPSSTQTMDIINIVAIWGQQRITLQYMPWSQFTTRMRPWLSYQDIPAVFTIYGQSTFYIGPTPSQAYSCEIDTVILPVAFTDDTTADAINYPYTAGVSYYASYLAKEKQQAYEESDRFLEKYKQKMKEALQMTMTRRIPIAY